MKIKWNEVTWYSKAIAALLFLVVFGVGFYVGVQYGSVSQSGVGLTAEENGVSDTDTENAKHVDVLNAMYQLGGDSVALQNGQAFAKIKNSSAKEVTKIATHAYGELSDDDVTDAAVVLTQQSGGSGTFFYLATVSSASGGEKVSDAVFLGDRIAVKHLQIASDRRIVIDYLKHAPDEPMSAKPTDEVHAVFALGENGSLIEQSAA